MESVHLRDGGSQDGSGETPVFDHALAAGAALLGRLEEELDRTGQALSVGDSLQDARRAEADGRVAVVAAGVHDTLVLRRVSGARFFRDR